MSHPGHYLETRIITGGALWHTPLIQQTAHFTQSHLFHQNTVSGSNQNIFNYTSFQYIKSNHVIRIILIYPDIGSPIRIISSSSLLHTLALTLGFYRFYEMTYHEHSSFKIGLENKLFLLTQETIPSSFPLCIVSQGGNKECKAMSHDLSLTRIHTSLDRALESWVGSTTALWRGETNFTETNVSVNLRPTRQCPRGQRADMYEWSSGHRMVGPGVTGDMWPVQESDGMLMPGPV